MADKHYIAFANTYVSKYQPKNFWSKSANLVPSFWSMEKKHFKFQKNCLFWGQYLADLKSADLKKNSRPLWSKSICFRKYKIFLFCMKT